MSKRTATGPNGEVHEYDVDDGIPTPEQIEAETMKPLDGEDLEIIESVLIPAGVLGTTLAKIRRMREEAEIEATLASVYDEGCPDFLPGTVLRHHVDGTHSTVLADEDNAPRYPQGHPMAGQRRDLPF